MLGSLRFNHRLLSSPQILATLAFVVGVILPGSSSIAAQGTHLWLQAQMGDFEKGTPEGVAIESDGHLRPSSSLTELATTPSTFVWTLAVGKDGHIYTGTGTPASVLRIADRPGEKPFTLFESRDLTVQTLCIGPDGALYAATVPSGKVYKLNPDATTKQDENSATVVFDAAKLSEPAANQPKPAGADSGSSSHYIWALTFDPSGRLYIATGNPGAIYRVDPSKPAETPELFFKSDEAHLRALAWDGKGNLIAGSDGSGLVYRIDSHGKGYVLFEAPRREITSLAVGKNGTIYAASVGDKSHNPLPPLPVQGAMSITITVVQPESLQAANASASVPEGTEIYALAEGQAPRPLWSSKDDIVYAMSPSPDGLIAISGNRGHIFRIRDDGSYADIGHLQAQQGLTMAPTPSPSGFYIGTGNTGRVYLLGASQTHEYASDVLDAGTFARFGRIEIEPGSSGYQILTRTGNVEQPVRGWSDWQTAANGAVVSPPGRFLQWKAVLQTDGALGSVGVDYLPVNSAPVIDNLVVVPGARLNPQASASQGQTMNISFPSSSENAGVAFDTSSSSSLQATKDRTAVTVRWAAHDTDGDKLVYSLYLRGDGDADWWLLKKDIDDEAYSFDATEVPDGGYQIKVVASDGPSHTPAEALTGDKISDRFVVDTTPPQITDFKATGQPAVCEQNRCHKPFLITFDAVDAASPIAHAGYSLDAGPWQYIDPVGMLSDSQHEHYEVHISLDAQDGKIGEHLITVRAYDRYDNEGVSKTVIPAQQQ
jgi:hypothetical protein